MKSLLDIEQEIRKLEGGVQGIADSIKTIRADIGEMRNAPQEIEIDYEKIEILAKQIPFGNHPLNALEDVRASRMYLEMLLNIIRLDPEPETTLNRLVWIQWLHGQSKVDWALEELYKSGLKLSRDSFYEFVEAVPEEYREIFMVDALVIGNLDGRMNGEVLSYLAGLGEILGIGITRLSALSLLARTVLCQSVSGMGREVAGKVLEEAGLFQHYIDEKIVRQALRELRDVVVEVKDSEAVDFEWKVKQKQIVKKGDVVAAYQERPKMENWGLYFSKRYSGKGGYSGITEVTATSSGVIFQFRDNNTNYGVIAHETDNMVLIKAWVKGGRA